MGKKIFHSVPGCHLAYLIAISFLVCLSYSNSLNAPFVFDDLRNILNNENIRLNELKWEGLYDAATKSLLASRPLAYISFAINYYFSGYSVGGYHVTNIVIHIFNGALVYFISLFTLGLLATGGQSSNRRSFTSQHLLIAFFTACIFVVHPLQTQSVTYIVQRMNSLSTLFYFLSLLLYILARFNSNHNKQLLLFVACFTSWVLGLSCKEISATLPLILFLYEWYFFQNLDYGWLKKRFPYLLGLFILFLGAGLIYLGDDPVNRVMGGYSARSFTLVERVLTEFRVLVFYISLLIFPYPGRLNLIHEFPVSHSLLEPATTLFSLIALLALLFSAIVWARKYKLYSFCILWFFINLAIESSIIPLELIFEHRLYLPMFGFSLLFVYLLNGLFSSRNLAFIVVLITLVMLLSIGTYSRNEIWSSAENLWRDVTYKNPSSYRAHHNLGNELKRQGLLKRAIYHYRQAIELNPRHAAILYNMGIALDETGQTREAIKYLQQALRVNPSHVGAHINLGVIAARSGKQDKAISHYKTALKIDNNYEQAHYNLANALQRKKKFDEAILHYKRALILDPEHMQARNNLAIIFAEQGKFDEAIVGFLEVLNQEPDNVGVLVNLGNLYSMKENIQKACWYYSEAYKQSKEFYGVDKFLNSYCK